MKKLIALLLAVVMVMGLAACGSKTTTETKAPTEAKVDTPATEAKTDAPAAAGSVYYLNSSLSSTRLCRVWPPATPRRPACLSRS